MKNVKIATRISIIITAVLVIGFGVLWKVVDTKSAALVGDNIKGHMEDSVETRAYIINNYVKSAEEYMTAFAKGDEVRNLLLNPDSEEMFNRAQQYTVDFASVKGVFEGLYIADTDSHVLTHTNEKAIGIYTREGEGLEQLRKTVLAEEKLTNSGIMKSPSTGNMVISMYYPVFDNGKCIGYVGSAVYASKLMESLITLEVEGLPDCEYIFLNVETGEYLYNEDEELLCTVTEETGCVKMINKIKEKPEELLGVVKYTDDKGVNQVVEYRYIPDRNWVFAVKDTEAHIYKSLYEIRKVTAWTSIAVSVVVIIVLVFVLTRLSAEIGIIRKAISKLGDMKLAEDESLNKYSDRKDEIGIVCATLKTACANLSQYIGEVDRQLTYMAEGDFSRQDEIEFAGDFKRLEESIVKIREALRDSFSEIGSVTDELTVGSQNVADASAGLASAASKASMLVAEIDDHIIDISHQLTESASFAESAKIQSNEASEIVSVSKDKMEELNRALARINVATAAIEQISNNMENFAKQTNILALNALVEASRAGDAGKGFGVVANEIRELAEQSNNAAVAAYEMIEQTVSSITEGIRIGKETTDYLTKVVSQTTSIDEAVSKIADATRIQNEKLIAITERLNDINKTVETTASMAQQSAAASNELDGQANVLKQNIGRYRV